MKISNISHSVISAVIPAKMADSFTKDKYWNICDKCAFRGNLQTQNITFKYAYSFIAANLDK